MPLADRAGSETRVRYRVLRLGPPRPARQGGRSWVPKRPPRSAIAKAPCSPSVWRSPVWSYCRPLLLPLSDDHRGDAPSSIVEQPGNYSTPGISIAVAMKSVMQDVWTQEFFEYHGEFASSAKYGFTVKPVHGDGARPVPIASRCEQRLAINLDTSTRDHYRSHQSALLCARRQDQYMSQPISRSFCAKRRSG
jgi:hypothetical protein